MAQRGVCVRFVIAGVIVATIGAGFCAGLGLNILRVSAFAARSDSPPALFTDFTVNVQNFSFSPTPQTINSGDTVKWNWVNGTHSVVFNDGVTSGTPNNQTGIHFQRTFAAAGTYDYICGVHGAGMSGRVVVVAATATISGHVSGPQGQALGGVAVTLAPSAGPKRRVRTNAAGDYLFTGVNTLQSYTIVPKSRIYTFTSQNVNVSGNLTNVDFTGQAQAVESGTPAPERTKRD